MISSLMMQLSLKDVAVAPEESKVSKVLDAFITESTFHHARYHRKFILRLH